MEVGKLIFTKEKDNNNADPNRISKGGCKNIFWIFDNISYLHNNVHIILFKFGQSNYFVPIYTCKILGPRPDSEYILLFQFEHSLLL